MVKRIMKEFRISEVSAVDHPAQIGARAVIMKRDERSGDHEPDKAKIRAWGEEVEKGLLAGLEADERIRVAIAKRADLVEAIAKSMGSEDGAESFTEAFREVQINQTFWRMMDALNDSVRSILKDDSLDANAKMMAIRQSADQFVTTVQQWLPETMPSVETVVAGVSAGDQPIGKQEKPMTDDVKKVADLEKQIADLTKRAEAAEAEVQKLKDAEIAKNDEVITVGGKEIRKSKMDPEAFAVIKAQADDLAKRDDEIELGKFQKRAEDEFGNLPGEPVAKAKALRAVSKLDEETRKTIETMLKSGNETVGKGMKEIGGNGGDPKDGLTKAETQIDAKAKEIAKRDSVTYEAAYTKALDENPDLYKQYQDEQKAA